MSRNQRIPSEPSIGTPLAVPLQFTSFSLLWNASTSSTALRAGRSNAPVPSGKAVIRGIFPVRNDLQNLDASPTLSFSLTGLSDEEMRDTSKVRLEGSDVSSDLVCAAWVRPDMAAIVLAR